MSELPEGWAVTPIKELFAFKYGKGLPQEKRNSGSDVHVYGSNGIVGTHDLSITNGITIIVGRKGSVGQIHLSLDPCWPIDTTYFIDEFYCQIPANYWALYLKSLQLEEQDQSSAIPGISREDIYQIEVAVPPLAEQRRIIAKLEMLLGKVGACQQRLAKIPVLLKRFRQAVLSAACSGKLTVDWRKNDELENDLPSTWSWVEIKELLPKGGIFDGPFGSNLKTSDYTESGVRVIRLENIGHLKFFVNKETYISHEKYETLIKHTVKQGDIRAMFAIKPYPPIAKTFLAFRI